MAAGIIALLEALPAIFQMLNRLGLLLDRLVKYSEQNNLNAWMDKLEASIDQLEKAKTPDEKLGAAQNLVGIIGGLGPK